MFTFAIWMVNADDILNSSSNNCVYLYNKYDSILYINERVYCYITLFSGQICNNWDDDTHVRYVVYSIFWSI